MQEDRKQEGGSSGTEGNDREQTTRETREAGQRAQGGGAADDVEATNTDGRGTGGVGADAGGYGPVPGSVATG